MSLLVHVDDIVVSDPIADLSLGGIPNGIPRVAAPWEGIVTRIGGQTQLCEVAIFDAAEAFQFCGHIDGCVERIYRESWR